ncbi:ABC transporter permease [Luteipulveratus sp. YIM 133132]|uniref:ABC transporter permease n=1 Tax=Luteipulveratus flavus TaxID=3031728 RepID=UPI0023AEAA99|nr:ABC transporter permease [Luteipulveratus sp. YIM 133132]MDE9366336.1 ABC transporter permease [Luteipulveratus sp. YIM 133132]
MSAVTTTGPAAPALKSHVSVLETIRQSWLMAGRALQKMRRNPEQFFDVLIQPLLFTPMFGYIFGGAIAGGTSKYLPLLVPGLLAQTALTTCMGTGVTLREDMEKGVFDRFRSLPMSRVAPLAGPALADVVRYVVATVMTLAVGIAMGYRPDPFGLVLATLLIVFTAWSLAWVFTALATVMKSAQGLQGVSMMIMFPLTFLSNAFVPASSLPGWLEAFVNVNPVSHVVTALRDLMNEGQVTGQVGWAVLACLAVVAIFMPLAVKGYRRQV